MEQIAAGRCYALLVWAHGNIRDCWNAPNNSQRQTRNAFKSLERASLSTSIFRFDNNELR